MAPLTKNWSATELRCRARFRFLAESLSLRQPHEVEILRFSRHACWLGKAAEPDCVQSTAALPLGILVLRLTKHGQQENPRATLRHWVTSREFAGQ